MNIVKCPNCGKRAEKRGRWKLKDGSYNRLYIHETKVGLFGFREVTKSCIAREEADAHAPARSAGVR